MRGIDSTQLNEAIKLIQTSGKEEGEPELIEQVLSYFEPYIRKLSRYGASKNPLCEREDIEQQLRLRLLHIMESWPLSGDFARYTYKGLFNTMRNCVSQQYHGGNKSARLIVQSLDEQPVEIYHQTLVKQWDELFRQLEARQTLESFRNYLRRNNQHTLALAVQCLIQGNSLEDVAILLGYKSTSILRSKLQRWGRRAIEANAV